MLHALPRLSSGKSLRYFVPNTPELIGQIGLLESAPLHLYIKSIKEFVDVTLKTSLHCVRSPLSDGSPTAFQTFLVRPLGLPWAVNTGSPRSRRFLVDVLP